MLCKNVRFLPLLLASCSISLAAIPAGYTGKPYGGTPLSIPGKFYADRADSGACNVAYYHPGCPTYRNMLKTTGIDFAFDCVLPGYESDAVIAAKDVYWDYIEPGEWMKVTIDVAQAGPYAINMLVTNGDQQDVFMRVTIYNGADSTQSDTLKIPYIGTCGPYDFHSWFVARALDTVTLAAGVQVMKVLTYSNGPFNVRWTQLAQLPTRAAPVLRQETRPLFRFDGIAAGGGAATVRFFAPDAGETRISLFDAQGRLAASEALSNVQPGANAVALKSRLAPGLYVVRMTQSGSTVQAKTVIGR